mmetsp:Transcript_18675/g.45106  ORF Transcript_18675/g.45106 Transcript_18675/m.45106 type:complete len:245 (+) Transcript_18675:134-868(+)
MCITQNVRRCASAAESSSTSFGRPFSAPPPLLPLLPLSLSGSPTKSILKKRRGYFQYSSSSSSFLSVDSVPALPVRRNSITTGNAAATSTMSISSAGDSEHVAVVVSVVKEEKRPHVRFADSVNVRDGDDDNDDDGDDYLMTPSRSNAMSRWDAQAACCDHPHHDRRGQEMTTMTVMMQRRPWSSSLTTTTTDGKVQSRSNYYYYYYEDEYQHVNVSTPPHDCMLTIPKRRKSIDISQHNTTMT